MLLRFFFFCVAILPAAFCAEDFYKLLGIDKQASDRDIKRAYRTLSKKFHPDKNPGDKTAHQKFVNIAEAYDVLSQAETRRIYDQYGHEGLAQHKQGGGGGQQHDPFDLFSRFFGGSGHFGGQNDGVRRGPDQEVRVALPLRDFFNGADREFSVERQQICEVCEGSGSEDGKVETCTSCGGRGAKIQKHMLAPGIFQQMQTVCEVCGGRGKTIQHPCKVCGGHKVVRKLATHSIHIDRGTPKGHRIILENEADESPEWEAGNLIVQLQELSPQIGQSEEERTDGTFFRRKGRHLYWKEVLGLREAWLGDWTRNITHLDGHVVELHRARGEAVQPNTVQTIDGEGMPAFEHFEAGNLLVEYSVVIPDQMEKGMEKDFWALWEKWRRKASVAIDEDSGRPKEQQRVGKDEL